MKEQDTGAQIYTVDEMEAAIDIALIAGRYGVRTANSRDLPMFILQWAEEFEQKNYEMEDYLELIAAFAHEKFAELTDTV